MHRIKLKERLPGAHFGVNKSRHVGFESICIYQRSSAVSDDQSELLGMKSCGEGVFVKRFYLWHQSQRPPPVRACLARRSGSGVLMHVVASVEGGAREFIV